MSTEVVQQMRQGESPDLDALSDPEIARITPLPGRCIVRLDSPPTMSDLVHIPDSAQAKHTSDVLWPATILKITPRKKEGPNYQPEEVVAGDRVLLAMRLEYLNKRTVIGPNTAIWGKLEP